MQQEDDSKEYFYNDVSDFAAVHDLKDEEPSTKLQGTNMSISETFA
jgi:hypothetical protein